MGIPAVHEASPLRRDRTVVRRRADIDGLRALAIALVVTYHVWFDRVSGGVDVFLLVSAYLLTESFLRSAERSRVRSLPDFWIGRFARLLPAAAVTIVGVLVLAAVALPASSWASIWAQAWSSLFYTENWQLAADAVDYYARDEALPSPLMHFWSLSIQGQVFLLWPLLIIGGLALARRVGLTPRRMLFAVFAVVFAVSLTYSVVSTAADQTFAYFDTGARLWEFALGSLAAIVAPRIRIGATLGRLLGWAGLVGLIACGFVLDVRAGFPGSAALWPTLCAIAILWAGQARVASGPTRLLSSPALAGFGRIAYALYLVHWPILIGYLALSGMPRADPLGGTVVILTSLGAAIILHMTVERPLVSARTRRRRLTLIVASILVVVIPVTVWQGAERIRALTVDAVANPGAATLLPGAHIAIPDDAPLIPQGALLGEEWVSFGGACDEGLLDPDSAAREICMQRHSSTDAAPTVLIVGNSHAEQWTGALLPLAEEADWNLVGVYKGGCAITRAEIADDDVECIRWQEDALRFAEAYPADAVVMVGTRTFADGTDERVPYGLDAHLATITNSGSDVVLLRDSPRFDQDMFGCLERSGTESADCTRPRNGQLAQSNPVDEVATMSGVHTVDLADYFCPANVCEAAIGNVAVYMDDNHMTWAYAKTLVPAMRSALDGVRALALS